MSKPELRCLTALDLKDRNEYDASREAMFPIWSGSIGSRPNIKGLSDAVAAEVLLTTGILTGWLGSRSEIKKADDYARDLITESITLLKHCTTQGRLRKREQNSRGAIGAQAITIQRGFCAMKHSND